MNTRILSTSLFCVALACSTIAASATVRPEIAQPLNDAVQLSRAVHPDKVAIMEKWKAVQAVPGKTREEQRAIFQAKSKLAHNMVLVGQQPDNFDPMAPMAPSGVPDFGPAGMPVTDAPAH